MISVDWISSTESFQYNNDFANMCIIQKNSVGDIIDIIFDEFISDSDNTDCGRITIITDDNDGVSEDLDNQATMGLICKLSELKSSRVKSLQTVVILSQYFHTRMQSLLDVNM